MSSGREQAQPRHDRMWRNQTPDRGAGSATLPVASRDRCPIRSQRLPVGAVAAASPPPIFPPLHAEDAHRPRNFRSAGRQNRQPLATLLDVARGRGGRNGHNGVVSPDELDARAEAAALYERYSARIHRFCVRRLGDRDEAADAVQDTFLRAWLALRDGAEVRFPVPWLLTIAENVCVSRFRARLARVTTTELSERSRVGYSDPVSEVAGLATALRALPDRQRQALLRREVQGYSYDEIGEELGVSRASVAALIHRARHTVADRLRDARREVAALVPIPAVLRAPFEHGVVASVAATSVAAVAIAVPQLAAPPSASSSPPSAAMGEPAHVVGADHVVDARTSLRRAAAPKQVVATVMTSGSTALGGPPMAKASDGGVVFVAEF